MKKSKIDKEALDSLIAGGVYALSQNRKYYYNSAVGVEYSHWTESGKDALAEYTSLMVYKMKEAEEAELNQRAKNLILNELKGDSK